MLNALHGDVGYIPEAIHPGIARSVWDQVAMAMRNEQPEQLNILLNWLDEHCAGLVAREASDQVRQHLQVARWEGH